MDFKRLLGFAFNWLSVIAAYYGTVENQQWAINFVLFAVFFTGICSILSLFVGYEKIIEVTNTKPDFWSEAESHLVDFLVLLMLVFAGWFWCAGFWIFQWIGCFSLFDARKKYWEKKGVA